MKSEYIDLSGHKIYVRHRLSDKNRIPVLFLHGIGESGRCFFDAVSLLLDHNVIIPDLLGFGKSEKVSSDPDYTFSYQIKIVQELIAHYDLKDVVLVGHSWGGMLGTLLCLHDEERRIAKYVCVEGGISKSSTIMSLKAVDVLREIGNDMGKFGHCMKEGGLKKTLLEDLESSSTLKFYDSLIECDPVAFAQTSKEICDILESEDKEGNNEISIAYREIKIPKIYAVGTRAVMNNAREFVVENKLDMKVFDVPSHWIMLDMREEFYSFLQDFIAT